MWQNFSEYFFAEIFELLEWAKCGSSYVSVTPTVLWGAGAAALSHRMLEALFRRFLFRRVPLWERVLQNLLFVWMIIYSLQFWAVLVKILKIFVQHCYEDASILLQATSVQKSMLSPEDAESSLLMEQWVIWMCGALPLATYIHTRPRPVPPPLMIWITTNPWLRREMGPNGYYLNRPPSLESATVLDTRRQTLPLRKAFSDTNILIKEPPKRKRHSKSV